MITQCCECRMIRQGESWVHPPQGFPNNEHVSHGYCPDCAQDAIQSVDDEIALESARIDKPQPNYYRDASAKRSE